MENKFNVNYQELINILIERSSFLKKVDYYLPEETQYAIDRIQVALDEYKNRVEKFQKEHSLEGLKPFSTEWYKAKTNGSIDSIKVNKDN